MQALNMEYARKLAAERAAAHAAEIVAAAQAELARRAAARAAKAAAAKKAAKRAAITVPFSDDLKRAFNARSQDVASDLRESDPECVAECCADSLEFIWDQALGRRARDELSALCAKYPVRHVMIEASRHVATW